MPPAKKFKPVAPNVKEERYKQPEAEEDPVITYPSKLKVSELKEGQRIFIGPDIVKLVRKEKHASKRKLAPDESHYLLHVRMGREKSTKAHLRRGGDLIGVPLQ